MSDLKSTLIEKYGFSEQSAEVAIRADFKCEYCGKDFLENIDTYDLFQIDHILPQSKIDLEELDNYALSCQLCNKIKRNTLPEEPEFLTKTREEKIKYYRGIIDKGRDRRKESLRNIKEIISKSGLNPNG